jgi:hypothetical protein
MHLTPRMPYDKSATGMTGVAQNRPDGKRKTESPEMGQRETAVGDSRVGMSLRNE